MTPYGKKGLIRLVVFIVTIMDAIRRLFYGTRPIDAVMIVIELLVLIVIAWEALSTYTHRKKMLRMVSMVSPYAERGLELQHSAPSRFVAEHDQHAYLTLAAQWKKRFHAWDKETKEFLSSVSQKAASLYLQFLSSEDTPHFAVDADGNTVRLFHDISGTYQVLQSRLSNLRRIMENPSAYF